MTAGQRALFGFILLGVWAALIAVIAIGHVEEATSFGLHECIAGLAFLSGSWAQATFGHVAKDEPTPQPEQDQTAQPPA